MFIDSAFQFRTGSRSTIAEKTAADESFRNNLFQGRAMRFIWRIPQIPIGLLALSQIPVLMHEAIRENRLPWENLWLGIFMALVAIAVECRIRELVGGRDDQTSHSAGSELSVSVRPLSLVVMALVVWTLLWLVAIFLHKLQMTPALVFLLPSLMLSTRLLQRVTNRHKPRLRIDQQGIECSELGRICWADVRTLSLRKDCARFQGIPIYCWSMLELKLRNASQYASRLRGVRGWLKRMRARRCEVLAIKVSGLDVPTQAICTYASNTHREYRRHNNLPPESGDDELDAAVANRHSLMQRLEKADDPTVVPALLEALTEAEKELNQRLVAHARKANRDELIRLVMVFVFSVALIGLVVWKFWPKLMGFLHL